MTLTLLWSVCHAGVHGVRRFAPPVTPPVRQRDLLFDATGVDTDRLVNDVLIPFCGAFLDQGIAHWTLPNREQGFLRAWIDLNRDNRPVDRWMHDLPTEIKRIETLGLGPLEIIEESLQDLGITDSQREEFLSRTLLALGGWAGMIWQTETNAEWIVRPSPRARWSNISRCGCCWSGSRWPASPATRWATPAVCATLRRRCKRKSSTLRASASTNGPSSSFNWPKCWVGSRKSCTGNRRANGRTWCKKSRAFSVHPTAAHLSPGFRAALSHPGARCGAGACAAHVRAIVETPDFQVVCCLDEREESFRRHLEEVAPGCETFSVAGFFGVAMYYRGVADAHYVPLCPIVIKPQHYVQEEVAYSFAESHRRRSETRRAIGKTSHWLHAVAAR